MESRKDKFLNEFNKLSFVERCNFLVLMNKDEYYNEWLKIIILNNNKELFTLSNNENNNKLIIKNISSLFNYFYFNENDVIKNEIIEIYKDLIKKVNKSKDLLNNYDLTYEISSIMFLYKELIEDEETFEFTKKYIKQTEYSLLFIEKIKDNGEFFFIDENLQNKYIKLFLEAKIYSRHYDDIFRDYFYEKLGSKLIEKDSFNFFSILIDIFKDGKNKTLNEYVGRKEAFEKIENNTLSSRRINIDNIVSYLIKIIRNENNKNIDEYYQKLYENRKKPLIHLFLLYFLNIHFDKYKSVINSVLKESKDILYASEVYSLIKNNASKFDETDKIFLIDWIDSIEFQYYQNFKTNIYKCALYSVLMNNEKFNEISIKKIQELNKDEKIDLPNYDLLNINNIYFIKKSKPVNLYDSDLNKFKNIDLTTYYGEVNGYEEMISYPSTFVKKYKDENYKDKALKGEINFSLLPFLFLKLFINAYICEENQDINLLIKLIEEFLKRDIDRENYKLLDQLSFSIIQLNDENNYNNDLFDLIVKVLNKYEDNYYLTLFNFSSNDKSLFIENTPFHTIELLSKILAKKVGNKETLLNYFESKFNKRRVDFYINALIISNLNQIYYIDKDWLFNNIDIIFKYNKNNKFNPLSFYGYSIIEEQEFYKYLENKNHLYDLLYSLKETYLYNELITYLIKSYIVDKLNENCLKTIFKLKDINFSLIQIYKDLNKQKNIDSWWNNIKILNNVVKNKIKDESTELIIELLNFYEKYKEETTYTLILSLIRNGFKFRLIKDLDTFFKNKNIDKEIKDKLITEISKNFININQNYYKDYLSLINYLKVNKKDFDKILFSIKKNDELLYEMLNKYKT